MRFHVFEIRIHMTWTWLSRRSYGPCQSLRRQSTQVHLQLALRVYGLLDVRVLKTVRSDVFQTARANSTKQSSHFTNAC